MMSTENIQKLNKNTKELTNNFILFVEKYREAFAILESAIDDLKAASDNIQFLSEIAKKTGVTDTTEG